MPVHQPTPFPDKGDYYEEKERVIQKFRKEFFNGNYIYDAQFHSIVEMLVRGTDPYRIIEELILDRQRLAKSFEEVLKKQGIF